jgi:hypothetical protein
VSSLTKLAAFAHERFRRGYLGQSGVGIIPKIQEPLKLRPRLARVTLLPVRDGQMAR